MAQAATPGELGLPCSPKQALALYKHLFWCPAGLGQLRAALRQVREARPCLQAGRLSVGPDSSLPPGAHEGWACLSGLELPTLLLEMERSRRAQEQVGPGWGVWQSAERVPPHILAPHLSAAPVGLGAADRGRARPLLASPGPVLWSEGPGPECMEPAQQAPWWDRSGL